METEVYIFCLFVHLISLREVLLLPPERSASPFARQTRFTLPWKKCICEMKRPIKRRAVDHLTTSVEGHAEGAGSLHRRDRP